MEASKEGEMPSEPAPETLPTEIKEERKKFPMLLAVIIVVIIIVAAIGAAFGLGLIGKKKAENLPPIGGARALGDTTIDIGGSVSFTSTSYDPDKDGSIVNYTWKYGDGAVQSGAALTNVSHTYNYGGFYWVYLVVTDNEGANGSNEASMIRIIVRYYDPGTLSEWGNATAPFAIMGSDADVVTKNTTVNFNMSGSYGIHNWTWVNDSDHSEGQNQVSGSEFISSAVIDFGDGSATQTVTAGDIMTASHKYVASGHYAAKFTVHSLLTTPYVTDVDVQTTVIRTIHVLTAGSPVAVKNPGTFIEATIGEPDSLDPAVDYESSGGNIIQNVYETLLWYEGASVTVLKPQLATSIPTIANGLVTPDGLNYTFNIRQGVKFHDNNTMTADDVAYSMQRVFQMHDFSGPMWMMSAVMTDNLEFSVGEKVSTYLDASRNMSYIRDTLLAAGGYNHVITEQDIKNVSQVVVVKVNATAVKFRLTHPYPGFLAISAYTIMSVVEKAFVDAHGGITPGERNDYMNTHMMGTGPYKLVVWERGAKIHLQAWSGYWNTAGKAKLNDVYIIKSEDVNARELMLQAGDADNIYLPIAYEATFTGNPLYQIKRGEATLDITFGVFNCNINSTKVNALYGGTITDNFFADKTMRKAFVYLFDYATYLHSVAKDNAIVPPNGVIPKGLLGYNADDPTYSYDLTKARDFLKNTSNPLHPGQSWYETGFVLPLFYNSGNTARFTSCNLIKSALEALHTADPSGSGVMTATITGLDWGSAFIPEVYTQHNMMPIYVLGWAPDYADPDDYTVPMLDSEFGTYPIFSFYNNSSIDAKLRAAASELDPTVRAQLYEDMNELVYNDTPYLWLTQPNNFNIFRSWVTGYEFNPMYSDLYYAVLDK